MKTMTYKGFEIQAKPQLLANDQWRIGIDIEVQRPDGIKSRRFSALSTFPTEEEAVEHCFNFGRQVIDGVVPNCTVSDL